MAIEFKCPSCNHEIVVKYLNIGDEFMCSHCKLRGTIPETGEPVTSYSEDEKPQRDIISETNETITFYNKSEKANNISNKTFENHKTNVRFPAIKTLSIIITVLAWISSVVFLIVGLVAISEKAVLTGIGYMAIGVLVLIVNLAIAQLLLLFLAIEENTRK